MDEMDRLRGSLLRALTFAVAAAAMTPGCTPGRSGNGTTPRGPTTEVQVLREIQLTEQARLPEQDPNLIDVEVGEDYLVFVYNREVMEPPIAVGNVVSGILHGGYLRRIVGVSQESPTRIRAMTEHAELGELIGDGHFRVIFHPGDGTGEHAVGNDDLGVAIEELSAGWSVFTPEIKRGGFSCGGAGEREVTIKPKFDIDVGMEVDVDIQWSRRWGVPPVRGELEYAIFALTGAVEAGLSVNTTSNVSLSCSYDLMEAVQRLTGREIKFEWTTTFTVGPVPVVLTHEIKPTAEVSLGVEVETGNTTAAASGRIQVRVGTEYTRATGWRTIWEPSRRAGASLTTEQPGKLSIRGEFSAGLEYSCKIYDAFGPGFGFGPEITATFSSPPPYCDWSVEVEGALGVSGNFEVEIPVIDYKLAEFSISESIAESTWYMRTGTFPWCRDGGMPDAGTPARDGGGGNTPRDGGGSTPGDGGMSGGADSGPTDDPCSTAGSTCQTCNSRAGCGFCVATGRCMSDSRRAECAPSAWRDSPSECEVCDGYTDCRSCVGDGFCGWCFTTGTCMTAVSGGGPPVPCPDWNFTSPSRCP